MALVNALTDLVHSVNRVEPCAMREISQTAVEKDNLLLLTSAKESQFIRFSMYTHHT